MRIGHGYDVHRLAENRRLVLGGVEIPYEKGLLGHSDADVLTHAVMDSLLGALALGDIGKHFPDTDPDFKGADSMGYQTFIVDYRLRPYTQEEGALDVARAVRFIRKNAGIYGIDPNDIAVMGYSAGGIQAGEFFLHYDEDVLPTALDPDYIPDELDEVSAHASACGMIYSFYGRLSVASMDEEALRAGALPPTFYCYGAEDPFYRQFEAQYSLMQDVGISTRRIVLQDWPHGFGGDGGWVEDYAQ